MVKMGILEICKTATTSLLDKGQALYQNTVVLIDAFFT